MRQYGTTKMWYKDKNTAGRLALRFALLSVSQHVIAQQNVVMCVQMWYKTKIEIIEKFLEYGNSDDINRILLLKNFGFSAFRNLHLLHGVQEAAGSNPVTRTTKHRLLPQKSVFF